MKLHPVTAVELMDKPIDGSPSPKLPARKKNKAAVELGRLGGLKGGKARAESLTPAERKAIASRAATIRWQRDREGS